MGHETFGSFFREFVRAMIESEAKGECVYWSVDHRGPEREAGEEHRQDQEDEIDRCRREDFEQEEFEQESRQISP